MFLWAGHLAETGDAPDRAEALYEHARRGQGRAAPLATLYLARLLIKRKRPDQAARIIEKHLAAHPEDAPARALLAVARRQKPAAGGK